MRKSDGSNTMLEKPCCTLHCADANFHLVDGSFGPSLSEDLAPSLPRRCAYPSVCGYVSLVRTQKTATGCELTLDLRDDSEHRAPWHETSEIRAMAQLSLQHPGCLLEYPFPLSPAHWNTIA